jgi:hypothetical protein
MRHIRGIRRRDQTIVPRHDRIAGRPPPRAARWTAFFVRFVRCRASSDFPVTSNAFQPAYAGGPADAFIVILNRRGSRARFSSFLGGSGDDGSAGAGEWLDRKGNFYVPGFTDSQDFPVTRMAFQTSNAGGYDVFLVKLRLPKGAGTLASRTTAETRGSSRRATVPISRPTVPWRWRGR